MFACFLITFSRKKKDNLQKLFKMSENFVKLHQVGPNYDCLVNSTQLGCFQERTVPKIE